MIKTHHLLFPPPLTHNAWYGPFTMADTCMNDRVKIWDHTRWYAKVQQHEMKHVKDYVKVLNTKEY